MIAVRLFKNCCSLIDILRGLRFLLFHQLQWQKRNANN
jgi:hypothetical protein